MTYEGNCRLGDLFTSRREKGRSGLPTLSVTLNDGLVNREDLDRKQDTSLTPEEHLLVKPGDIAYNMMRMWQGACGLAQTEGLVSPAYVVLAPNDRIDARFAAQLFKSPRMKYLLRAYSYGLTDDRLRLYASDFSKIPIYLPTKDRQQIIAKTLETIDSVIAIAEHELAAVREEKLAHIQKLLDSGPKAVSPTSTTRVRLGSLGRFVRGVAYQPSDVVIDDISDAIPILRAHNIRDAAVNSDSLVYVRRPVVSDQQVLRKDDVVICMSNGSKSLVGKAASFQLTDKPYSFGAFCAVFRPNDKCDVRLIPHLFYSKAYRRAVAIQLAGSSINNLRGSDLQAVEITLPASAMIQKNVANIFNTFDSMCELRNLHLAQLRQMRKGLLARLFFPGNS